MEKYSIATPIVIILRGAPGVGKTSTTLLLREKLAPAARISVDTLRYFVSPKKLTAEQLRVAKLNSAKLAVGYAESGISSIIESVFENEQIINEMKQFLC